MFCPGTGGVVEDIGGVLGGTGGVLDGTEGVIDRTSSRHHARSAENPLPATKTPLPPSFREKLEGSLLKGGFDGRVRIDLPVPLPVPTPPPTFLTPLPFSLIFQQGKLPPETRPQTPPSGHH